MSLVKDLNNKLEEERYTKKHFWEKYLKRSGVAYGYFINQLNGFAAMQENVEHAINNYLGE